MNLRLYLTTLTIVFLSVLVSESRRSSSTNYLSPLQPITPQPASEIPNAQDFATQVHLEYETSTPNVTANNNNTNDNYRPLSKKKVNRVRKCPKHFLHYRFPHTNDHFCYTLTKKQPYPPKCPYPNYAPVNASNLLLHRFIQPLWMEIERPVSPYDIGQFISTNPQSYRLPITNYTWGDGRLTGKRCMIIHRKQLKAVNCNGKFQTLCMYRYPDTRSSKFYCGSTVGGVQNCTLTTIDIENSKCFCESSITSCQLAEPRLEYENYVLAMSGLEPKQYRIGMYQEGDQVAKWISDQQTVCYNLWADGTNLGVTEGILNLETLEWELVKERTCSNLCEQPMLLYGDGVTLTVSTNCAKSHEILFINHFQGIAHATLACFRGTETFNQITRISDYQDRIILEAPEYDHYFWCEAFQRPNYDRIKSNVILVRSGLGLRYTLNMKVNYTKEPHQFVLATARNVQMIINNSYNICKVSHVIPLNVFNINVTTNTVRFNLHLQVHPCSIRYQSTIQIGITRLLEKHYSAFTLRNNQRCAEEVLSNGPFTVTWPETEAGKIALSQPFCLQEDSTPITRKCLNGYGVGAEWNTVRGVCHTNNITSNLTSQFLLLIDGEPMANSTISTLNTLTTAYLKSMTPFDVGLVAQILSSLLTKSIDNDGVEQIIHIVDNIMQVDVDTLTKAQNAMNSTDNILELFDAILLRADCTNVTKQTKSLLIWMSDRLKGNVKSTSISFSFSPKDNIFELSELGSNETIASITEKNVDVAILLPDDVLRQIDECSPTAKQKIVVSLFQDNGLFASGVNTSIHISNNIINVLFHTTETICYLNEPFSVIFKANNVQDENYCAFWNYGLIDEKENIQGHWKIENAMASINDYVICNFTHATHFGLLVRNIHLSEGHQRALEIITMIGSCLSLCGSLLIGIIKICVRKLRKRTQNTITFNFLISITIQIVLLYLVDKFTLGSFECSIVAVLTHYVVLVEFMWMLVVGLLQYRKFVTVLYNPTPYLAIKTCIFAWGLPLFPILILLLTYPDSYTHPIDICYITFPYFYYALLLPITVIVTINTVIFALIICSLCRTKVKVYHIPESSDRKLHFYLAIVLFFMLGMTWIFGLIATLFQDVVFSYLFCCTASFQAVVMFLFFIPMNTHLVRIWKLPRDWLQHLQSKNMRLNPSVSVEAYLPNNSN